MEPTIVAALISGGFAIISLAISLFVNARSNKQNKRLNEQDQELKKQGNDILELASSRDYELVENVKTDLMSLIAVLHSIGKTSIYMNHMPQGTKMDLSIEYSTLGRIKNSASYLYLLKALKEQNEDNLDLYFWFDVRYNILLGTRDTKVALQLLNTIKNAELDFGRIEQYKVQDVYSEFAKFSAVGYGDDEGDSEELTDSTPPTGPNDVFEDFVIHLVEEKSCEDPDVMLFYSVFKNDPEITKNALDNGANTRCTDKMIVEKYNQEHKAFVSKNQK